MRDCPSCGNEIPVAATRCKYCFADLSVRDEPRNNAPFVGLLLLALVVVAAGWWAYSSMYGGTQLGNVTLDPSENRVVLVYTAIGKDPTTRQVSFDEITGVEMQANESPLGGIIFEVYLLVQGGERLLINRSTGETLEAYAGTVAKHTNKALTIISNIRTGKDIRGFSGGPPAGT